MCKNWELIRAGRRYLSKLRCGHYEIRSLQRRLRGIIESGVSLHELGTSQDEIDGFPRLFALRRARNAVISMRNGLGSDLRRFQKGVECAVESGISLTEIGTNQEELERLPRMFALRRAQKAIHSLRSGNGVLARLKQTIVYAIELGISPQELGTNLEELGGLPRVFTVRSAQKVVRARQGNSSYGDHPDKYQRVIEAARAMHICPTEYGLSEKAV